MTRPKTRDDRRAPSDRAAKWTIRKACTIWEPQNQLVLVAQQRRADGSLEFSAGYRPVPPHVLCQWIPWHSRRVRKTAAGDPVISREDADGRVESGCEYGCRVFRRNHARTERGSRLVV